MLFKGTKHLGIVKTNTYFAISDSQFKARFIKSTWLYDRKNHCKEIATELNASDSILPERYSDFDSIGYRAKISHV
jgi:hypothetical protein